MQHARSSIIFSTIPTCILNPVHIHTYIHVLHTHIRITYMHIYKHIHCMCICTYICECVYGGTCINVNRCARAACLATESGKWCWIWRADDCRMVSVTFPTTNWTPLTLALKKAASLPDATAGKVHCWVYKQENRGQKNRYLQFGRLLGTCCQLTMLPLSPSFPPYLPTNNILSHAHTHKHTHLPVEENPLQLSRASSQTLYI